MLFLFILRRSKYAKRHEVLENAVVLKSAEAPENVEKCYFLSKKKRKLLLYSDIVSFNWGRNGVPYEKFKF